MSEVSNFRRFFAVFKELPCGGDREEFRRSIVRQYTWGRTDSLREMTREEYEECCEGLEKLSDRKERLRKERSACLKLMQKMGIDTSDWARVNNFCQNPRIAGKVFARIGVDEFPTLMRKLRAIERKPPSPPPAPPRGSEVNGARIEVVRLDADGEA